MARRAASTIEQPSANEGELVSVDPAELVIGANIRIERNLDKGFVDSIRERGVLEPIRAYRDDVDQVLVVIRGQRRTLGAIKAGRPTVPVIISPRPSTVDAVVDQVTENDHRAAISTVERAAAYQQLSALGIKPAQIAKRLAAPRDQVEAGLAAARSEVAAAALAANTQMTLEQGAVLAEFDDNPAQVAELLGRVERGGFEHLAQRYRDDRARAAAEYAAGAELRAAGVRVITWVDASASGGAAEELQHLEADGIPDTSVQAHAACPGHAAVMDDEEFEELPDDAAGDAAPGRAWKPIYICTRPDLHLRSGDGPDMPAQVDDEVARARAEREAADRAEQVANNKAWASATKVRQTWLKSFLTRKTPPKGSAVWVAQSLANNVYPTRQWLGTAFALELVGARDVSRVETRAEELNQAMVGLLDGATDQRAQVITLGMALAAYETQLVPGHWQNLSDWVRRYLRFLDEQGYELSEVELRACGVKPKPKRASRA